MFRIPGIQKPHFLLQLENNYLATFQRNYASLMGNYPIALPTLKHSVSCDSSWQGILCHVQKGSLPTYVTSKSHGLYSHEHLPTSLLQYHRLLYSPKKWQDNSPCEKSLMITFVFHHPKTILVIANPYNKTF